MDRVLAIITMIFYHTAMIVVVPGIALCKSVYWIPASILEYCLFVIIWCCVYSYSYIRFTAKKKVRYTVRALHPSAYLTHAFVYLYGLLIACLIGISIEQAIYTAIYGECTAVPGSSIGVIPFILIIWKPHKKLNPNGAA
jgi:hypothetical protein